MKSVLRITSGLLEQIHEDLSRPHDFAGERVAFLSCRTAGLGKDGILFLAHSMHVVADEDYERSNTMGALISGNAFRKVLQYCYGNNVSLFHIHRHEHAGRPVFSKIDIQESAKFVPDFFKVRASQPHGAIVLSHDSAFGHVWRSGNGKPERITRFVIVGQHITDISDEQFG